MLVDLQSGQTLHADSADRRFIPASITKVMSIFVAFEMLKAGEIRSDQTFTMSEGVADDWYRTGSTMFLEPGEEVSVDLLLRGMASVSANDASTVLAEGAAGSIDDWVARMNAAARDLGMTQSHFATPNGWPDEGKTFTTANDLAKLASALVTRHPELYAQYFGKEGLRHNGFAQANHDPISGVLPGADGIKTGYTGQAGHGFLGSAERDGTRLIMVLGAVETEEQRAKMARDLMNWGFDSFDRRLLFDNGAQIGSIRVQNGAQGNVNVEAASRINLAIPKGSNELASIAIHYEGPLQAPIAVGEVVAHLQIDVAGSPSARVPLVASEDVAEAGPFRRIANAFENWFG
ncbi:D-alanyl-D-alanine carboxypeptidase [Altererythrobacter aestiaquae]|uniref:serine-type D-Ala-D-Ala carboxypeptidase n=1 Tax=Pontixanthobacter aestiaquae TaxID=1509367 RepID=A0A844Z9R7_9SPHN|nr:D-alanyl-D-alanine carboxypeptidase [Pontixanthobacter aestiaquae]